jgi:hypothetical protein
MICDEPPTPTLQKTETSGALGFRKTPSVRMFRMDKDEPSVAVLFNVRYPVQMSAMSRRPHFSSHETCAGVHDGVLTSRVDGRVLHGAVTGTRHELSGNCCSSASPSSSRAFREAGRTAAAADCEGTARGFGLLSLTVSVCELVDRCPI